MGLIPALTAIVAQSDPVSWEGLLKLLGLPGGALVIVAGVLRLALPPIFSAWKQVVDAQQQLQTSGYDNVQRLQAQQEKVNESQRALTQALNEAQAGARELVREIRDLHRDQHAAPARGG